MSVSQINSTAQAAMAQAKTGTTLKAAALTVADIDAQYKNIDSGNYFNGFSGSLTVDKGTGGPRSGFRFVDQNGYTWTREKDAPVNAAVITIKRADGTILKVFSEVSYKPGKFLRDLPSIFGAGLSSFSGNLNNSSGAPIFRSGSQEARYTSGTATSATLYQVDSSLDYLAGKGPISATVRAGGSFTATVGGQSVQGQSGSKDFTINGQKFTGNSAFSYIFPIYDTFKSAVNGQLTVDNSGNAQFQTSSMKTAGEILNVSASGRERLFTYSGTDYLLGQSGSLTMGTGGDFTLTTSAKTITGIAGTNSFTVTDTATGVTTSYTGAIGGKYLAGFKGRTGTLATVTSTGPVNLTETGTGDIYSADRATGATTITHANYLRYRRSTLGDGGDGTGAVDANGNFSYTDTSGNRFTQDAPVNGVARIKVTYSGGSVGYLNGTLTSSQLISALKGQYAAGAVFSGQLNVDPVTGVAATFTDEVNNKTIAVTSAGAATSQVIDYLRGKSGTVTYDAAGKWTFAGTDGETVTLAPDPTYIGSNPPILIKSSRPAPAGTGNTEIVSYIKGGAGSGYLTALGAVLTANAQGVKKAQIAVSATGAVSVRNYDTNQRIEIARSAYSATAVDWNNSGAQNGILDALRGKTGTITVASDGKISFTQTPSGLNVVAKGANDFATYSWSTPAGSFSINGWVGGAYSDFLKGKSGTVTFAGDGKQITFTDSADQRIYIVDIPNPAASTIDINTVSGASDYLVGKSGNLTLTSDGFSLVTARGETITGKLNDSKLTITRNGDTFTYQDTAAPYTSTYIQSIKDFLGNKSAAGAWLAVNSDGTAIFQTTALQTAEETLNLTALGGRSVTYTGADYLNGLSGTLTVNANNSFTLATGSKTVSGTIGSTSFTVTEGGIRTSYSGAIGGNYLTQLKGKTGTLDTVPVTGSIKFTDSATGLVYSVDKAAATASLTYTGSDYLNGMTGTVTVGSNGAFIFQSGQTLIRGQIGSKNFTVASNFTVVSSGVTTEITGNIAGQYLNPLRGKSGNLSVPGDGTSNVTFTDAASGDVYLIGRSGGETPVSITYANFVRGKSGSASIDAAGTFTFAAPWGTTYSQTVAQATSGVFTETSAAGAASTRNGLLIAASTLSALKAQFGNAPVAGDLTVDVAGNATFQTAAMQSAGETLQITSGGGRTIAYSGPDYLNGQSGYLTVNADNTFTLDRGGYLISGTIGSSSFVVKKPGIKMNYTGSIGGHYLLPLIGKTGKLSSVPVTGAISFLDTATGVIYAIDKNSGATTTTYTNYLLGKSATLSLDGAGIVSAKLADGSILTQDSPKQIKQVAANGTVSYLNGTLVTSNLVNNIRSQYVAGTAVTGTLAVNPDGAARFVDDVHNKLITISAKGAVTAGFVDYLRGKSGVVALTATGWEFYTHSNGQLDRITLEGGRIRVQNRTTYEDTYYDGGAGQAYLSDILEQIRAPLAAITGVASDKKYITVSIGNDGHASVTSSLSNQRFEVSKESYASGSVDWTRADAQRGFADILRLGSGVITVGETGRISFTGATGLKIVDKGPDEFGTYSWSTPNGTLQVSGWVGDSYIEHLKGESGTLTVDAQGVRAQFVEAGSGEPVGLVRPVDIWGDFTNGKPRGSFVKETTEWADFLRGRAGDIAITADGIVTYTGDAGESVQNYDLKFNDTYRVQYSDTRGAYQVFNGAFGGAYLDALKGRAGRVSTSLDGSTAFFEDSTTHEKLIFEINNREGYSQQTITSTTPNDVLVGKSGTLRVDTLGNFIFTTKDANGDVTSSFSKYQGDPGQIRLDGKDGALPQYQFDLVKRDYIGRLLGRTGEVAWQSRTRTDGTVANDLLFTDAENGNKYKIADGQMTTERYNSYLMSLVGNSGYIRWHQEPNGNPNTFILTYTGDDGTIVKGAVFHNEDPSNPHPYVETDALTVQRDGHRSSVSGRLFGDYIKNYKEIILAPLGADRRVEIGENEILILSPGSTSGHVLNSSTRASGVPLSVTIDLFRGQTGDITVDENGGITFFAKDAAGNQATYRRDTTDGVLYREAADGTRTAVADDQRYGGEYLDSLPTLGGQLTVGFDGKAQLIADNGDVFQFDRSRGWQQSFHADYLQNHDWSISSANGVVTLTSATGISVSVTAASLNALNSSSDPTIQVKSAGTDIALKGRLGGAYLNAILGVLGTSTATGKLKVGQDGTAQFTNLATGEVRQYTPMGQLTYRGTTNLLGNRTWRIQTSAEGGFTAAALDRDGKSMAQLKLDAATGLVYFRRGAGEIIVARDGVDETIISAIAGRSGTLQANYDGSFTFVDDADLSTVTRDKDGIVLRGDAPTLAFARGSISYDRSLDVGTVLTDEETGWVYSDTGAGTITATRAGSDRRLTFAGSLRGALLTAAMGGTANPAEWFEGRAVVGATGNLEFVLNEETLKTYAYSGNGTVAQGTYLNLRYTVGTVTITDGGAGVEINGARLFDGVNFSTTRPDSGYTKQPVRVKLLNDQVQVWNAETARFAVVTAPDAVLKNLLIQAKAVGSDGTLTVDGNGVGRMVTTANQTVMLYGWNNNRAVVSATTDALAGKSGGRLEVKANGDYRFTANNREVVSRTTGADGVSTTQVTGTFGFEKTVAVGYGVAEALVSLLKGRSGTLTIVDANTIKFRDDDGRENYVKKAGVWGLTPIANTADALFGKSGTLYHDRPILVVEGETPVETISLVTDDGRETRITISGDTETVEVFAADGSQIGAAITGAVHNRDYLARLVASKTQYFGKKVSFDTDGTVRVETDADALETTVIAANFTTAPKTNLALQGLRGWISSDAAGNFLFTDADNNRQILLANGALKKIDGTQQTADETLTYNAANYGLSALNGRQGIVRFQTDGSYKFQDDATGEIIQVSTQGVAKVYGSFVSAEQWKADKHADMMLAASEPATRTPWGGPRVAPRSGGDVASSIGNGVSQATSGFITNPLTERWVMNGKSGEWWDTSGTSVRNIYHGAWLAARRFYGIYKDVDTLKNTKDPNKRDALMVEITGFAIGGLGSTGRVISNLINWAYDKFGSSALTEPETFKKKLAKLFDTQLGDRWKSLFFTETANGAAIEMDSTISNIRQSELKNQLDDLLNLAERAEVVGVDIGDIKNSMRADTKKLDYLIDGPNKKFDNLDIAAKAVKGYRRTIFEKVSNHLLDTSRRYLSEDAISEVVQREQSLESQISGYNYDTYRYSLVDRLNYAEEFHNVDSISFNNKIPQAEELKQRIAGLFTQVKDNSRLQVQEQSFSYDAALDAASASLTDKEKVKIKLREDLAERLKGYCGNLRSDIYFDLSVDGKKFSFSRNHSPEQIKTILNNYLAALQGNGDSISLKTVEDAYKNVATTALDKNIAELETLTQFVKGRDFTEVTTQEKEKSLARLVDYKKYLAGQANNLRERIKNGNFEDIFGGLTQQASRFETIRAMPAEIVDITKGLQESKLRGDLRYLNTTRTSKGPVWGALPGLIGGIGYGIQYSAGTVLASMNQARSTDRATVESYLKTWYESRGMAPPQKEVVDLMIESNRVKWAAQTTGLVDTALTTLPGIADFVREVGTKFKFIADEGKTFKALKQFAKYGDKISWIATSLWSALDATAAIIDIERASKQGDAIQVASRAGDLFGNLAGIYPMVGTAMGGFAATIVKDQYIAALQKGDLAAQKRIETFAAVVPSLGFATEGSMGSMDLYRANHLDRNTHAALAKEYRKAGGLEISGAVMGGLGLVFLVAAPFPVNLGMFAAVELVAFALAMTAKSKRPDQSVAIDINLENRDGKVAAKFADVSAGQTGDVAEMDYLEKLFNNRVIDPMNEALAAVVNPDARLTVPSHINQTFKLRSDGSNIKMIVEWHDSTGAVSGKSTYKWNPGDGKVEPEEGQEDPIADMAKHLLKGDFLISKYVDDQMKLLKSKNARDEYAYNQAPVSATQKYLVASGLSSTAASGDVTLADGQKKQISVKAGEALLAIDRDGDGLINSVDELLFLGARGAATTARNDVRWLDPGQDGGSIDFNATPQNRTAAERLMGLWSDENNNGVLEASEFKLLSSQLNGKLSIDPSGATHIGSRSLEGGVNQAQAVGTLEVNRTISAAGTERPQSVLTIHDRSFDETPTSTAVKASLVYDLAGRVGHDRRGTVVQSDASLPTYAEGKSRDSANHTSSGAILGGKYDPTNFNTAQYEVGGAGNEASLIVPPVAVDEIFMAQTASDQDVIEIRIADLLANDFDVDTNDNFGLDFAGIASINGGTATVDREKGVIRVSVENRYDQDVVIDYTVKSQFASGASTGRAYIRLNAAPSVRSVNTAGAVVVNSEGQTERVTGGVKLVLGKEENMEDIMLEEQSGIIGSSGYMLRAKPFAERAGGPVVIGTTVINLSPNHEFDKPIKTADGRYFLVTGQRLGRQLLGYESSVLLDIAAGTNSDMLAYRVKQGAAPLNGTIGVENVKIDGKVYAKVTYRSDDYQYDKGVDNFVLEAIDMRSGRATEIQFAARHDGQGEDADSAATQGLTVVRVGGTTASPVAAQAPVGTERNGRLTTLSTGYNGETYLSGASVAFSVTLDNTGEKMSFQATEGEMILWNDSNGSGTISETELLGQNGGGVVLSALDSNGDGYITKDDTGYSNLKLLLPNTNGSLTSAGTLADMGINYLRVSDGAVMETLSARDRATQTHWYGNSYVDVGNGPLVADSPYDTNGNRVADGSGVQRSYLLYRTGQTLHSNSVKITS